MIQKFKGKDKKLTAIDTSPIVFANADNDDPGMFLDSKSIHPKSCWQYTVVIV